MAAPAKGQKGSAAQRACAETPSGRQGACAGRGAHAAAEPRAVRRPPQPTAESVDGFRPRPRTAPALPRARSTAWLGGARGGQWAGHGAGSGRGTGRAVGGASPWGGAWRQRLAGAAGTGHRVGAPGPEPLRSAAGTGGCAAPAPPAGRPRTPVSAPTAPPHPAYPRSPATAPGVPPAPQGAPRTPGPSPGPTAPVSPQAGRPPGPRGPVSLPQGAGGVPGGYFWAVARQPPGSARRPHVTGAAGPRRRSHSSRRPGSSGTAGAPAQTGRDGRRHFLPAGELLGAGEGQLSPAGLPALPRALPAPLPARLLPQLLRQLPAGPRQRRPPVLPALRAPLGGEGGHRAAPRGPAPAVLGGQLSRQRGGRAVRQLRPALRQGGAGHHVLLQHLRAAPLRPVPRGDPPRQDVRPPRDRLALQAHQRRPQEVPPARGALHHVLHREEVHALHQLLQGHAGGEPGALHRHRDGVHAGLPAPGPGGDGGQGRRVRGRGDTGARGCPQRRSRPAAPGQAVKELQTSTREAIVLLKAMIEEVHNSASEEEAAINSLFGRMQEQLSERKKTLLKAVQSQHEEKEKAFKEQLAHLASLLPTLQVHLVTCSAFLSSANKAEFLDLGYQLMERLQRIVKLPHRLRPAQTSKINSEYRAEFARCLEPLLVLSPRRSVVGSAGGIGPGIAGTNMLPVGQCSKTLMVPSCPPAGDKTSTSPLVRKPTMHRYISTKVLLAEGRETPFAEHCRNYESTYRALQLEIQGLKDQVQELHRDLTKHHSLIKTEIMSEILQKSLQMDVQIAAHYSAVEMMRSVFEEVWEETYQRVANEQEIYEAQLHDLLQLRQENSCLTTITKQIAPYVRSIAKVKERLEPRLQEPREPKEEQAQMLLKVCDDSEAAPRDTSPGSSEGAPASPGEGCTPRDPPPKSKECRRGQPSGAESAAQPELAP